MSVAGFTGNTDPAFPNALLAGNVAKHDPDVLFFSGDQLYEGVGGYGIHRTPVDVAVLNYLRKFWLIALMRTWETYRGSTGASSLLINAPKSLVLELWRPGNREEAPVLP
ncbi:MAG: hypothetical protein V3R99_14205, partial [Thermoguttaceae bacterium]